MDEAVFYLELIFSESSNCIVHKKINKTGAFCSIKAEKGSRLKSGAVPPLYGGGTSHHVTGRKSREDVRYPIIPSQETCPLLF
ncbi:MAG: hypothetical protein VR69_03735 [Peptococcaceae bacterium BRH_c4b]|nr:MAG: hypothetical protein VR69_03735 [Peptococcaceae bacterium BRH_c4b]